MKKNVKIDKKKRIKAISFYRNRFDRVDIISDNMKDVLDEALYISTQGEAIDDILYYIENNEEYTFDDDGFCNYIERAVKIILINEFYNHLVGLARYSNIDPDINIIDISEEVLLSIYGEEYSLKKGDGKEEVVGYKGVLERRIGDFQESIKNREVGYKEYNRLNTSLKAIINNEVMQMMNKMSHDKSYIRNIEEQIEIIDKQIDIIKSIPGDKYYKDIIMNDDYNVIDNNKDNEDFKGLLLLYLYINKKTISKTKYFLWDSTLDSRTCQTCMSYNQNIYLSFEVPDYPHPNCRCIVIPLN